MNKTSRLRTMFLFASLSAGLWACGDLDRDTDIEGWNPNGSGGGLSDDGSDADDSGDDGSDDGGSNTSDDDGSGTGDDDGSDTGDDGSSGTSDDGGETVDPPPEDSPYEGGWDIGNCQGSIQGNATQPGQINVGSVLLDWTLPDQFGDQVRFYDFCHKVIYYEVVTEW